MNDFQIYVKQSLELHLFFARIMKEHAIFLQAGFTPANPDFAREARNFQKKFEDILSLVTQLGHGLVCQDVLNSQEIVTCYTFDAECQTENFTSIDINKDITQQQLQLQNDQSNCDDNRLVSQVQQINMQVIRLLEQYIAFKESIIQYVLTCRMFTLNYPLLLKHILREAKQYLKYLVNYENGHDLCKDDMQQEELFWNQIMMEHALFIRGSLDPSEAKLIQTANDFVKQFSLLLNQSPQTMNSTTNSLNETQKIRDFKQAGTKGILNCEIRSIILPLLADHVLREANHYIRLLQSSY